MKTGSTDTPGKAAASAAAKAATPEKVQKAPKAAKVAKVAKAEGAEKVEKDRKTQAVRKDTQPAAAGADGEDFYTRVRLLAYSYYEARGCIDGHEAEDWARAEADVSSERAARHEPAAS